MLAGIARPADAAYRIVRLAEVPVTLQGRAPLLEVMLDGRPARFVLDTGSERSVIAEAAATRLGLARDPWVGTTMSGIGGIVRRPNARPRTMTLGGVPLVRRTLSRDTSLAVAPLRPDARFADGLLGRDYLSAFDLDLDLAGGRLGLMAVRGCAGRFPPWPGGYQSVPVTPLVGDAVVLPVTLDGATLRAMLDTGSAASLLTAPGMYRMKLDAAALAADPAVTIAGLGPRAVIAHRHVFRALGVGGIVQDAPALWVAPVHPTPIVDMLLGMDWLAGRHIWISFATHQVFVAKAG